MFRKRKHRNRRHARGHVLNVKLSSSQRREHRTRRLTWFIAAFLLVFGVVYGGWRGVDALIERWVYNNDAFAITQMEIETDGVLAPEQLRSWAGVRPKSNLMRLDLARVKRDLEMVPAIESVAVERVLPDTLRIHVSCLTPGDRWKVPYDENNAGLANVCFGNTLADVRRAVDEEEWAKVLTLIHDFLEGDGAIRN